MTTSQNNGLFFWRDHRSADAEKAKAFYAELFDWTYETMPVDENFTYDIYSAGDQQQGGFSPLMPGEEAVPPHWVSYIGTRDIDKTVLDIAANGGTVVTPVMEIPTIGRFSVFADPTGAHAIAMTLFNPIAVDTKALPPVGGVSWNELYTTDVAAAQTFYTTVFDQTADVMPMEEYGDYQMLAVNGDPIAGMFLKPDEMPVSAWGIYFRVADADAAAAKIVELGGTILGEPMDVPFTGRMVTALDSTGAYFSVLQPLEQ
jgi:hypothetical protein